MRKQRVLKNEQWRQENGKREKTKNKWLKEWLTCVRPHHDKTENMCCIVREQVREGRSGSKEMEGCRRKQFSVDFGCVEGTPDRLTKQTKKKRKSLSLSARARASCSSSCCIFLMFVILHCPLHYYVFFYYTLLYYFQWN
jgi:hypothetical protein